MKFTLEINCDNAAFGDSDSDREAELARILNELANNLAAGQFGSVAGLRDINGNRVGRAALHE